MTIEQFYSSFVHFVSTDTGAQDALIFMGLFIALTLLSRGRNDKAE